MPNEKIEVGYRHIGTFTGVEYHHKFLLYTDKNGHQSTISGWTDEENQNPNLPFGNIRVKADWEYDAENPDNIKNRDVAWYKDENRQPISPQKQYREPIAEAPDLSAKWAEMVKNARSKDNIYPYDYLRQNSNTLADAVLREAGFPEPKKDGMLEHLAPGSGNKLDKTLVPKNPDNPSISDVGDVISLKENVQPRNAVQPAALTLDDMPQKAQELCRQCREHYVAFHQAHNLPFTERMADNVSAAIGAEAYLERVPHIQALHINKQGIITVGHETPAGDLTYASLDVEKAAATPVQESIARAKQAEQVLAQQDRQLEMEIAQYRAQSQGMSYG